MDSLFTMTWRCQTQASTCNAPWPLMAALPGAGGSSMANWRTGPSPVFHHQLHSAHSRLPLYLSALCWPEMPAESAQGDLPVPGSAVRPGFAAAMGAEKAPPSVCLLSKETRRKQGSHPPGREPVISMMLQTWWPDPCMSVSTCQQLACSLQPGSRRPGT